MNVIGNQPQPGFKGYFDRRVTNPPHPSPTTQKEKDENLFALGTATGMDMMEEFDNFKKIILIAGGGLAGACMPKRIIKEISAFATGREKVILPGKILMRTRAKAALAGAVFTTGLVAVAGLAVKKAVDVYKSLMPPKKDENAFIHPVYKEVVSEFVK